MANKKDIKDPKRAYTPPSSAESKIDMVRMVLSGEETTGSLSRMTGTDKRTIDKWVNEVAPGFATLRDIEELDTKIIEERGDKLSAAARIVVIARILDLVQGTKDIKSLASVLRELKSTPEASAAPAVNNYFTEYVQEQIKIINKNGGRKKTNSP